jgi:hypothetical protein
MTVIDNTPRDQYTATSGQTVFPYTFEISASGDIVVLQNGAILNEGTGAGQYGISGVGSDSGGNITLVTGATTGDVITLYRDMALDRLTSYTNGGDFLAADVNNDFDRLWLALQQNTGTSNRALVAPNTDPLDINMTIPDKDARRSKFLKFNSVTGNPEASNFPAGDFAASGMNIYSFTGDGATVNYTLGMEPGGDNNTQIYIDGVYQQKINYSVFGAIVTFSTAPPNLSSIEVMVIEALPVGTASAPLVSFTQAGSTYNSNVQRKLEETVSVKDFGAVGDGATDDTAAINLALNLGGNIYFPPATYIINGNLTVGNNTTLIGSGKTSTILHLGPSNYIHFSGDYSGMENLQVYKTTTAGNYVQVGVLNLSDPAQSRFTRIDNCKFDLGSFPSFVNYACIGNYKSFDLRVTNCLLTTGHLALITKYFSSQRITFENNVCDLKVGANGSAELVKIEAIYEAYINNNTFYSTGSSSSSGLLSLLTLESGSYQTMVSNNKFINDYGNGIRIENADSPTFPGKECIIENNIFESNMTNANCILSGNTSVTNFNVNNNTFVGKVTFYGDGATIDSNYFNGDGNTSNTGIILRGDDLVFKNNTIRGYQYGLTLGSTSTSRMNNLAVIGNYFIGQDSDSVTLKYLLGNSSFANNVIIHETATGTGSLYCLGSTTAASEDILTISNNTIVSPSVTAVAINSMNGITIKNNQITAATRYSLVSTDAYNEDDNAFTTTLLTSIGSRVNIQGKYEGKMVFNTTSNKPVYAAGSAAGDVWVNATGTTENTPV